MPTVNELVMAAIGSPGTYNERLYRWANGNGTETLNEALCRYLSENGGGTGTLNERWRSAIIAAGGDPDLSLNGLLNWFFGENGGTFGIMPNFTNPGVTTAGASGQFLITPSAPIDVADAWKLEFDYEPGAAEATQTYFLTLGGSADSFRRLTTGDQHRLLWNGSPVWTGDIAVTSRITLEHTGSNNMSLRINGIEVWGATAAPSVSTIESFTFMSLANQSYGANGKVQRINYINNTDSTHDMFMLHGADEAAVVANTGPASSGATGEVDFGSGGAGGEYVSYYPLIAGALPSKVAVVGDSWGYYFPSTPSIYNTLEDLGEYYSSLYPATGDDPAPATPGRGLPTLAADIPTILTYLGTANVETVVCAIGINSITSRTFDQMRADYVTVFEAIDAAGMRLVIVPCQPGAPGGPMDAPTLQKWQDLQAWLPAYALGMGFDCVDLAPLYTYSTGAIKAEYCEDGANPSNATHMNQAGNNILAGLINQKLRAEPPYQSTAAVQAVRGLPNPQLLTTAELGDISTLITGLGDEVGNMTDIWLMTSDLSAGGNAVTGLINQTVGTFAGSPSYVGDSVVFTPETDYFASGINTAKTQGMGGKVTFPSSTYSEITYVMGARNSLETSFRIGVNDGVEAGSGTLGVLPLNAISSDVSGTVIDHTYSHLGADFQENTIEVVSSNGVPITWAGAKSTYFGAVTDPIIFGAGYPYTAKDDMGGTWRAMYIHDSTADVAVIATAINSV